MTVWPKDCPHRLLPVTAQRILIDAHSDSRKKSDAKREEIIAQAVLLVRKHYPEHFVSADNALRVI